MRKILITLAVLATLTGVLTGVSAYAQTATPMTDEHVARIKNACPSAIATLNQLHANDALVYVNRNQTYFSISDKLIARLNSRLALNRYDTTELAKIAGEYNTALSRFRTAYKEYDDAMGDLVRMNCNRQPVGFYDKTAEVRELRATVHETIGRLHTIINQYREAVESFKNEHETQLRNASRD